MVQRNRHTGPIQQQAVLLQWCQEENAGKEVGENKFTLDWCMLSQRGLVNATKTQLEPRERKKEKNNSETSGSLPQGLEYRSELACVQSLI